MKKIIGFVALLSYAVSGVSVAGQAESLNWLVGQQNSNGSIYLESDVANVDQSTQEAAFALSNSENPDFLLNINKAAAFNDGRSLSDLSTESLSRRILLKSSADEVSNQELQELLSRRNSRGGYSDFLGFPSSALSTSFALTALNKLGVQPDTQTIQYLLAQQQSDGAWLFPSSGVVNVELTAYAMSALWLSRKRFDLESSLNSAQQFLMSQRSADGLWDTDEATALALNALLNYAEDRGPIEDLVNLFLAKRLANGSLNNDVYLTSLLAQLEALKDALPEDAIQVFGKVFDADSGFTLANATIRSSGPESAEIQTGTNGEFLLSLTDPGQYSFVIESNGFLSSSFQANVELGDRLNLNDVFLSKETNDPDTQQPLDIGSIRGQVLSAATGLPLSGVSIVVNQSNDLTALTNDNGEFTINSVPAGVLTVQASIDGYASQVGSAKLEAQQTLIFSPTLETEQSILVTVFGTITDQINGDAVEGVVITVRSGVSENSVTTDNNGSYSVSDLPSGQLIISASKEGFASNNALVTAPAGGNIQYSPQLEAVGLLSSVFGVVTDSVNGQALQGAFVTVSNGFDTFSATTDVSGAYRIDGVPKGLAQITASISGFSTISASVDVQSNTQLDFSPSLPPEASNEVVVSGVIRDSESGAELSGVSVSAIVGSEQFNAITDIAGAYQISGIPTGGLSLTASLQGYSPAQGSINVPTSANIDFSPNLNKEDVAETSLKGAVIDSQTGLALPNATITIEYADTSISAVQLISDAGGEFEFTALSVGEATLKIELVGYIAIQRSLQLRSSFALDLGQQRLQSEPTIDSSTVFGVVVNSVTNEPIEGVLVASAAGNQVTIEDGAFSYSGLNAGEIELTFTKDGVNSAAFLAVLENGQELDLGQVRLRPIDAESLEPDLVVSNIDNDQVTTDLISGSVSGLLQLDVTNSGTQSVESGFGIVAFTDVNSNGVFDTSIDEILGEISVEQTLAANEAKSFSIALSGTQSFRDAPISIFVDSKGIIPESDEDNNVASTSESCKSTAQCNREIVPLGSPKVKWAWTGSETEPSFNQVLMTPLVAQANDDNGDGLIDANDNPDIIFTAHSRATANGASARGFIRIISGVDGSEIRIFDELGPVISAYSNLAVGDIDNDGEIEIVAPADAGGIYAFELDGSLKWYQPNTPKTEYGGVSLADLDGDGRVEIMAAGALLNDQGDILWQSSVFEGQFGTGTSVPYRGAIPLAADIDLDGVQEVIYGGTAFRDSGETLWQNTSSPDGLNGVGNFDADLNPEIVVVRNGRITLVDHNGETIWNIATVDGGEGGAPTIADYDNDGSPEIGVAGSSRYVVYESDGTVLWQAVTFDTSSRVTGSSVFDFNNDGEHEVVYADERNLHVFNGATGETIFIEPHSSATVYEYPVVVDIDNDGHAEVVVAQNDLFRPGNTPFHGIRVFEEENDSWVGTRSIWNQHAYSIDNVNDDGSIPTDPVKGWLTHNTFRLNAFPQCSVGDPVQKWNWKGGRREVVYGPVNVGQITDDNNDGVIDFNDNPDVIFTAAISGRPGRLVAVDGETGDEIWTTSGIPVSGIGSPAYADIDQDGLIEFVIPSANRTRLYAFEHTGELKWNVPTGPRFDLIPRDAVAIADLDGDGSPEIIHGRRAYTADGTLLWEGAGARGDNGTYGFLPLVADIDLDGQPNVVAGNTVYNADGSILWRRSDVFADGYSAIGNLDEDDFAEVILVNNGQVVAFEHDGSIKWGPVALPGGGLGGAPTVADIDGDGLVEIGIAGGRNYVTFENDGSIKWVSPTIDASSSRTGSSVFDFDDDGKVEIAYADEKNFRIYNGEDGRILVEIPNISATTLEYPVIADIDGDNHAEVLIGSTVPFPDTGIPNPNIGLRAFESSNDAWANTRSVWNQHTYHINNINDDGTVPTIEEPSWLSHNTYRLNTFIDRSASALSDLTVSRLQLSETGVGQPFTVSARIGNGGELPSNSSVTVEFFRITSAGNRELLASRNLSVLGEGEFTDISVSGINGLISGDRIIAIVNSSRSLEECDFLNNSMTMPVGAINGSIEVSTDQPVYSASEAVIISNDIQNTSNFANLFQVNTRIEDSNGESVIEFPTTQSNLLASDQQQELLIDWNTASLLTGTYNVVSIISSIDGNELDQTSSSFEIISSTGSEPVVTLNVTTDRFEYHINDTVELSDFIQNASTNASEPNASLQIIVTNPEGVLIYSDTSLVGDLTPSYDNNIIDSINLNNAVTGEYAITNAVISQTGAILASDSAAFNVVNNQAVSLLGDVQASINTVIIGEPLSCTDQITNTVALNVESLPIRQVLINANTDELIANDESTIDLAANDDFTTERQIDTSTLAVGNTYSCAIQAFINEQWVNLDNDFFDVTNIIDIDLAAQIDSNGRVLVLLDGNADQERDYLEALLNQAGWLHTITSNSADFENELQTNSYTNFLLLASSQSLSAQSLATLEDLVSQGAGLVDAGNPSQRQTSLDQVLGIEFDGQFNTTQGINLQDSELQPAGSVMLSTPDESLLAQLSGAISVATYVPDLIQSGQSVPAITLNEFGNGRSVYVGIDLLEEANLVNNTDNIYAQLILNALGFVSPEPALNNVGNAIPVTLTATNQGRATPSRVRLTLPDNVEFVGALSPDNLNQVAYDQSTRTITQLIDLEEGQSTELLLWLSPTQTVTLNAFVDSGEAPDFIEQDTASVELNVQEPPQDMVMDLGVAGDFNAFICDDFTSTSSDSHGRLAAGGNITIDSYGVATRLSSQPDTPTLIAGGDLSYGQGKVFVGSGIAGGSVSNVNQTVVYGLEQGATIEGNTAIPIDFEAQFAGLRQLSANLARAQSTGTIEYKYGGIYITGDCSSDTQVFNLDGATVLNSNHINLSCVPNDSTIIFNIDGLTAGFKNIGLSQFHNQAPQILYNFHEAETVELTHVGIEGSVLAPLAHFDNPRGQVNGSIVAKSWDGPMELHHFPFVGSFKSVLSNLPDPETEPDTGDTDSEETDSEETDSEETPDDSSTPEDETTTPTAQEVLLEGLGVAQSFNAFFCDDFNSQYSDSHGKIAAGGDVSLNGYGVASRLASQPDNATLVVGGDLSYVQGKLFVGSALVGGSTNNVNQSVVYGLENGASIQQGATSSIDFDDEFAQLRLLSNTLAQAPSTGTVEYRYGGVYITGDCSSQTQVFNLNGQTTLNSNHLVMNCVPHNATILFNIDGQTAGFKNIGLGQLRNQAPQILYNFHQANTVQLTHVGIEGTVLAPNAHFDNPRGQINGTVIGKSWNGPMELHDFQFTGSLESLSINNQ